MRRPDVFLTWPKVAAALCVVAIRHGDQPFAWVAGVLEAKVAGDTRALGAVTRYLRNFRSGTPKVLATPEERAAAKAISRWARAGRCSLGVYEHRIVLQAYFAKAGVELARLRNGGMCPACEHYAMKEADGREPWRLCPCAYRGIEGATIAPEYRKQVEAWGRGREIPLEISYR